MKLIAKLRLFWKNATDIPESEGIYTSCLVAVPLDQVEAKGYGTIEYDKNLEGVIEDDWDALGEFYSFLGNVPANAHPLMGRFGLPDEVQLLDLEWTEEDETEEYERIKKAQFPDWRSDEEDTND